MKKRLFILSLLTFIMVSKDGVTQNIESLVVEKSSDQSITIPSRCSPDDLIILINSSIPELKFESNILADEDFIVLHLPNNNQYIICHERTRFMLSVSGPNLQTEDIPIHDLSENHVYTLTSNIFKGTVQINTNPENSSIFFPGLNVSSKSTEPITNNSGKYRITINKANYKSIDTAIIIPRDTVVKVYEFYLEPLFAQMQLKIETEDNAAFQNAPILLINGRRISLDAVVKPNLALSFRNDVEFFKLYEKNIIPMDPGNYNLKIEADNYQPFVTSVFLEKGRPQVVPVMMELIFGYITFIDEGNAEGAQVYLNDHHIGEAPIFMAKARVGSNKIRIEKPGFMTEETEYKVNVSEKVNTDFYVSMRTSHKITFESKPSNAEILLNGERIGFTALSRMIPSGNYKMLIKKSQYSTEAFDLLLNTQSKKEDTIRVVLKESFPISIISEQQGLDIKIKGLNQLQSIFIENNSRTPAEIMLPYGKFKIKTIDRNNNITYSGKFNHKGILTSLTLPSYSPISFTTLVADFIDMNNYEVSLGRVHLFPYTGLSTAIINFHYFVFKVEDNKYETIIASPFFLNWDWRFGGSIHRNIDISALSRWKWTPGVYQINANLLGLHDAKMWSAFFGGELSSRLPYFNVNIKAGYQYLEGDIRLWSNENKNYQENSVWIPLQKRFIISFGLTVNGPIYKSNNMLRIWKKPFIGPALFL